MYRIALFLSPKIFAVLPPRQMRPPALKFYRFRMFRKLFFTDSPSRSANPSGRPVCPPPSTVLAFQVINASFSIATQNQTLVQTLNVTCEPLRYQFVRVRYQLSCLSHLRPSRLHGAWRRRAASRSSAPVARDRGAVGPAVARRRAESVKVPRRFCKNFAERGKSAEFFLQICRHRTEVAVLLNF